jgi:demethylmenaquinone methyltransferase / 2-methoxy-6-polyprenyl-1,4-benzoquinol methylase
MAKFAANVDGSNITVCDINKAMLDVGRKRAEKLGYTGVTWMEGNAEELSGIPDNTFDAYTISFGIRNVTHIDKVRMFFLFRYVNSNFKCFCRLSVKRTEY